MATPIHTWSYADVNGNILGVVRRYEEAGEDGSIKKSVIPCFKKEGSEWKPGGAPKPRPLFNLPGIHEKDSIIIVEGEKCAEALKNLGVPATTSCGGASSAKDADWSPCSTAKKIYLLPDADMPGETYIEQVAKQIAIINPDVRFFVLRIPELPPKGDIVDWIKKEVPAWDGYSDFNPDDVKRLKPLLRTLFLSAVAFYPDLYVEETPRKKPFERDNYTSEVRNALTFRAILNYYGKDSTGQEKGNGCTVVSSPFSSDSTPSFNFNENEKWFHCFSSGEGGDVFNLIAKLEGCGTEGSEWQKVLDVAEKITGLTRPKQGKKSNLTSILPKLPLDLNAIAPELCTIPNEGVSPSEAFTSCEQVLRMVAGSDGTTDEIVLDQIKRHFKLTTVTLNPFKKAIAAYRKELKETGEIEKTVSGEKPVEAPTELYMELIPKFLGKTCVDIFSGDPVSWDEQSGFWTSIDLKLGSLKSDFLRYGEKNNIRFWMPAVKSHLDKYCSTLKQEIAIDIPEWDGIDWIKSSTDRITLQDVWVTVDGVPEKIDQTVFEELIKEWHSKMWQKLKNPHVQNRVIIFQGTQHAGKDTWQWDHLAGLKQYLVKMSQHDSLKDARTQLHEGLAIVISEFDQMAITKKDAAVLKDMLTSARSNIRFSHDPRSKPRWIRCSFMANCNPKKILKDHTGNRRYIIFEIKHIDWAKDGSKSLTPEQQMQVLAQGKVLAEQGYEASERSQKVMKAYIELQTPLSPTAALIEAWHEAAQDFFETLTEEQQEACRSAVLTKPEFFGFLPFQWMTSPTGERLLAQLVEAGKFRSEKWISQTLRESGLAGNIRFDVDGSNDARMVRGFYWKGLEQVKQIETGNQEIGDMDFI